MVRRHENETNMTNENTLARQVAKVFDDNGQQWQATETSSPIGITGIGHGVVYVHAGDELEETLESLCEDGGSPSDPMRNDTRRWIFTDGSVIVTSSDGWDHEGAEPWSFKGRKRDDMRYEIRDQRKRF